MTPTASSYDALLAAAAARTAEPVALSTGVTIDLRGLTVLEFVRVLRAFPQLRDVLLNLIGAGEAPEDEGALAELMELFVSEGPEAIASVIAVAAGAPGDTRFRDAILALGDDDFQELLQATMRLTMPEGVSGFFARLGKVARTLGLAGDADPSTAEAT